MYLTGYDGRVRTQQELFDWSHWQHLDPELQDRVLWLLDASALFGSPLGIGSIWRSEQTADTVFVVRHHVVPGPSGIPFRGKLWALNAGAAPSMPGDRSYHCPTTSGAPLPFPSRCLALDFIGNLVFLHEHAKDVGMLEFGDINGEKWHGQGIDYPHGRSKYVLAIHNPLKTWHLPAMPSAQPTKVHAPVPVIRQRLAGHSYPDGRMQNNVVEVRALQLLCNFWGWRDTMNRTLIVDGDYGAKSAEACIAMQRALAIAADGVYGSQSKTALQAFLDAMVPK